MSKKVFVGWIDAEEPIEKIFEWADKTEDWPTNLLMLRDVVEEKGHDLDWMNGPKRVTITIEIDD